MESEDIEVLQNSQTRETLHFPALTLSTILHSVQSCTQYYNLALSTTLYSVQSCTQYNLALNTILHSVHYSESFCVSWLHLCDDLLHVDEGLGQTRPKSSFRTQVLFLWFEQSTETSSLFRRNLSKGAANPWIDCPTWCYEFDYLIWQAIDFISNPLQAI